MSRSRFQQFAWFFLAYLGAVILFGAWVRITGSGNGCGNHWPTCNGEVIPHAPAAKTLIEFTHRVTSALCGVFGIVLILWARRIDRRVFRASLVAMLFLLVEGFIGAVLVKKELVAGNASASRAIVIAFHLANTLLLTGSAAAVAWWADPGRARLAGAAPRGLLIVMLLALVLTNSSGAVTALGDTLFPTRTLLDSGLLTKVTGDLSATQHFLVRLRIIHPLVAVAAAALVVLLLVRLLAAGKPGTPTGLVGLGLASVVLQLCLGVLNVILAAPPWLQIVHLLVAQVVWILAWLVMLVVWPAKAATQPATR